MLLMMTTTSMLLSRSSWNLSSQSKLRPPLRTTVLALCTWSTCFFYFHDFAQIFSQFLQTYCQHFCTMFSQFNLILSQSSGDFTHNFLFVMTIVSRHLNHTVEISEPLVTTCGFQTSACNHCHHHESSWPSWLWASWKSWSDSYLIGDERAVNHLAVGRLPRCTWWWWWWWWW